MAPISARSRNPIKVLLSIESSSLRASSADSTGVLPRLTTYFGPRTEAAGLCSRIPPLLVAASGESPDEPAVCRHAAKDHAAAVAGGIKCKAEQISMTTPGTQGEVSPESNEENSNLQPSGAPQTRNRPLPALLEPCGTKSAKTLPRRAVRSMERV